MQSQKRLRDELQFVTECTALFDVMQQVAVSQLRQAEAAEARQVHLTDLLTREFFPLLPAAAHQDPLVRGGAGGRLVILITSDEGMVGPLYASVARAALAHADDTTQWVLIGQRGARLLGERAAGATVIPFPDEDTADAQMQQLSDEILRHCQQHGLREVWVIASTFISMTRQEVTAQRVLPLPLRPAGEMTAVPRLVLEPSCARVVTQMASWWMAAACLEAVWSSRRAEYAARAMHVEASRQELTKRAKRVRYEWFKVSHERVDVLVRESCVVQRHAAKVRARRAAAAMAGSHS